MAEKKDKGTIGTFSVSLNIYTMNTKGKNFIHIPRKVSNLLHEVSDRWGLEAEPVPSPDMIGLIFHIDFRSN